MWHLARTLLHVVPLAPLRWVERAKGNRRLALVGAYGVVVVVVGLLVWRQGSLRNLPDIGDPFDVEAFVARQGSRDEDAFDAFSRALDLLDDRDLPALLRELGDPRETDWVVNESAWSPWIVLNREAMSVWREGAERPSANPPWLEAADHEEEVHRLLRLSAFNLLALMEAARLEAEGDLAGAWTWYRALLRSGMHLQGRAGWLERMWGASTLHFAFQEIGEWAADPRVGADLLHRAIADVRAAEALMVSNSETLKAEYIRLMRVLDEPGQLKRMFQFDHPHQRLRYWNHHGHVWHRFLPGYLELRWWFLREPERSRRVARIAYANWLAHCDGIRSFHPPQAAHYPGLFVTNPKSTQIAYIYPSELYDWYVSSLVFEVGIRRPEVRDNWRERQEGRYSTLLITLAQEAYRRDHGGREAPTLDDLVGPYLDRLPPGYQLDGMKGTAAELPGTS